MFWIIQDGMYTEEGVEEMIGLLQRFDINYRVVSLDSDKNLVEPFDPEGLVFVCGTYSLARIARERGWFPGTFWNDNHEHSQWIKHWGERMLNFGARTSNFAGMDLSGLGERIFIRPSEDNKYFNGMVLDREEIIDWRSSIISGKSGAVKCSARTNADTLVTYGPTFKIYKEYRFFVIDGRIVTGSTYRVGQDTVALSDVDPIALEFAREAIDCWQPARGFVLDVALVEEGCKIVEVNCLNMAGFYGASVQKIIEAVECMSFDEF